MTVRSRDEANAAIRGSGRAQTMNAQGSEMHRTVAEVWPMVQRYCRARIGDGGAGWEEADTTARRACIKIAADLAQRPRDTRPLDFAYRVTGRTVDELEPAGGFGARGGMAAALRELGSREREVVILRLIEGLTVPQTASVLGMPDSKVQLTQHRAMRTLSRLAGATDCLPGPRSTR